MDRRGVRRPRQCAVEALKPRDYRTSAVLNDGIFSDSDRLERLWMWHASLSPARFDPLTAPPKCNLARCPHPGRKQNIDTQGMRNVLFWLPPSDFRKDLFTGMPTELDPRGGLQSNGDPTDPAPSPSPVKGHTDFHAIRWCNAAPVRGGRPRAGG